MSTLKMVYWSISKWLKFLIYHKFALVFKFQTFFLMQLKNWNPICRKILIPFRLRDSSSDLQFSRSNDLGQIIQRNPEYITTLEAMPLTIFRLAEPCYAAVRHSDWLLQIMWLNLTNYSALFHSYATIKNIMTSAPILTFWLALLCHVIIAFDQS